jgi:hypothetical protein
MWNGFIGRSIVATTKNLRRTGIGLLLVTSALGFLTAKQLANVIHGPMRLNEPQLVAVTEPKYLLHDYVTIQGTGTVSTGVTQIEKTTRNGAVESERTTAEFMAMIVGKHILIVRAKPGAKADSYTGKIVPLPGDLKKRIFSNSLDLQPAALPVMLETTREYDEDLIAGLVIAAVCLTLGLWTLYRSKLRREDPEQHPLCKSLSKYGPLYSLVPEIDAEFSAGASALGGVTFTQNWLIKCSVFESRVMRRDEIVWVYKKRTKHSVYFIPTGTTFASILRDSRGQLLEVRGSEEQVSNLLAFITQPMPWIIVGYNRKTDKLYRKQRQALVETVAGRKAATVG